ncbi:MAG: hypothetical protein EB143_00620 [Actinobacteria bacterium]|nr:hypothetical protein [Actinomycetota bacterium]
MLIATWNVNSLKARLPRVQAWLEDVHPDVVLMQETKMTDKAFPALTFKEMGYWWDYRNGSFHRGWGMRIDLLLATSNIADATMWTAIDRNARKGEQPSDHAPVLMEVST